MVYLAGHRAEAAHLPHQPLQHRHLTAPVGGPEFAGLLAEIDQDCARFEDADRLPSRTLWIDDRGDAVVWADLQESRVELLAFGDVHGFGGVRQAHLFQSDTDLTAVRGVPSVEFDAHRDPPFQSSIYSTHCSPPNGGLKIHRDRLLLQSVLRLGSEVFVDQRKRECCATYLHRLTGVTVERSRRTRCSPGPPRIWGPARIERNAVSPRGWHPRCHRHSRPGRSPHYPAVEKALVPRSRHLRRRPRPEREPAEKPRVRGYATPEKWQAPTDRRLFSGRKPPTLRRSATRSAEPGATEKAG